MAYIQLQSSLAAVDLTKRVHFQLHAFQSPLADAFVYDPAAANINGKSQYQFKARGLINNAKLISLSCEGILSIFDIDSDGSRLKLHSKTQITHSSNLDYYAVTASTFYLAVTGRTSDSHRVVKVLDRHDNKVLNSVTLSQGIFS